MHKKITLKIKKVLVSFFLLFSSLSFGQLAAGDIAFVGINADPVPNEISIVTLSAIPSGQTIFITDYAWNGSSLDASNSNAEGYIKWVTTKIVPVGTVIMFTINSNAVIGGGLSDFGTVTAVGWSGDAIASGGDNWFVLQGSIASPTFIYGYANWSSATYGVKTWPTSGVPFPNATISYLPSTLSNGTTANSQSGSPSYHFDNNVYTGIKAGTKSDVLAAIANSSNWSGSEDVSKDITPGGTNFSGNPVFAVGPPASVTAQPSNSSTCTATNTSFTISALNASGYKWEVNTGSGFFTVLNNSTYSGATTSTLTVTNVTNAMSGYAYRCVALGVTNATSNSATLTVKQTTAVTDTQVACDSYKWIDGVTYTTNNTTATFTRQNAAGCDELVTLNLTINKTNAPSGNSSQTAIITGTLADLAVTGNNIKWYDAAVNGTVLPTSKIVAAGTTYFASQNTNSCESKTRLAVLVTGTLANSEFEQASFSFYPNPVLNELNIKSAELIKSITVYNSLGQTVLKENANDFTVSIDLSNLPSGNFYVVVTSENKIKNIKIIKK